MGGCGQHWFALPGHLRDKVWVAYVPGQEITKTPSADYVAVAREIQAWIVADNARRMEKLRALNGSD